MIRQLDWAIAGYGQTVTLRREVGDDAGNVTVEMEITCPAAFRPYGPQDLEAGTDVHDIPVVLSPTGLGAFGIPKRDDRIILIGDDPSDIAVVAPRYYGGTLVRVNLLCRG